MQDFLERFSSVPKGFLHDFFNLVKEEYDDNERIINFDNVVKWLDVRKDHLKRLLIDKFEKNFDYSSQTIKKLHKDKGGSTREEIIMITPNCLKELCMVSQTAKAKEVRKYFLEIERLIKKYYVDIADKLYKEIGLLKVNQKPKTTIKEGVIYIIEALNTDSTLYKIGKTSKLRERLDNYNSGNANDIEPVFIMRVADIDKVETCLKMLLKQYQYRKYKEVYEIDLDLIKQLVKNCDVFTSSMAKYLDNNKKIAKKSFKRLKTSTNKFFMFIDENK